MGEDDNQTLKGSKPFILDVDGEVLVAVRREEGGCGAVQWEVSPGVYAAAVERAVERKKRGWAVMGGNATSVIEGGMGMGMGMGMGSGR